MAAASEVTNWDLSCWEYKSVKGGGEREAVSFGDFQGPGMNCRDEAVRCGVRFVRRGRKQTIALNVSPIKTSLHIQVAI
jgi:hypothetical protein